MRRNLWFGTVALLTRRQFLGAAGVSLLWGGRTLPASALTINPRSSWATDHPPKGLLDAEDVRFLLVHHSASQNGHTGADVPGILRDWYEFHTGPEKGWNDIAYNFVVDSAGGIWEAREGSLAGAVAGDATGGNQGFSQLVCVIGDYSKAHPSQASIDSLVRLLAWLADRHGISTAAGSQVSFTSRGSNLWPEGSDVTTPTITGHRTMSMTTCPGDNLFPYVAGGLMADVEALREEGRPASSTPSTTVTTTVPVATTSIDRGKTTTTALQATTTSTPVPTTTLGIAAEVAGAGRGRTSGFIASGAVLIAGVSLTVWRWRRLGG